MHLVQKIKWSTADGDANRKNYRNENGSKKKNNNRKKTKEKQSLMKRENKKGTARNDTIEFE